MKRKVAAILLAIVALAASPTYAQVTGGFKIGVNWADLDEGDDEADDEDNLDKRTGLAIGGFVDVPVAPGFSFQPEFLYSQKGAKFEDFDGEDVTIKYDVIQIPLLAKFNFGASDAPVQGFVVAGPGLAFRIKAEIDYDVTNELDEDIEDETESFEFSGIVGAGVKFGMASVEIRYDHGFTNLNSVDDDFEIKSRTFSVLFGVGWGR
jgi:hypothetical protein